MNGKFIKFNEITNHYQTKELNDLWLKLYPEMMDVECVMENKYDGCNSQFIFSPGMEIKVGSRNQLLTPEMYKNLNGISTVFSKYKTEFTIIQDYVETNNVSINLYCEFFGKGIQNRIDYGDDKYLKFIATRVNDVLSTPREFYQFLEKTSLEHMKCHIFGKVSLKEALEFDVEILEPSNNKENNYIEGIVIKPFNNNYFSPLGSLFILKKKSSKFEEKMKSKKIKGLKSLEEPDKRLIDLYEDFASYINMNRVLSAFSKEMRCIKDSSEISYFLKIILEDAKKDWKKDNSEEVLTPAEEKIIFNAGKKISKLLIDYMKGNS